MSFIKAICIFLTLSSFSANSNSNTSISNQKLYLFFLNFNEGLYYTNDGEVIDSREQIAQEIRLLRRNCSFCDILVIKRKNRYQRSLGKPRKNNDSGDKRYKISLDYYKNSKKVLFIPSISIMKLLEVTKEIKIKDYLKSHVFYFGHKIIEHSKETNINVNSLLRVVDSIKGKDSNKFTTLILSSCNNGTIATLERFRHRFEFAIGSSAELHLSMLSVSALDEGYEDYIDYNFEKIKDIDFTETSISLFDLKKLQDENELKETEEITIYNRYNPPKFTVL